MATRRFKAQYETVIRELRSVTTRMGATGLRVNQDLYTGEAEVAFDRKGKRYALRCKKWSDATDNLRATQRAIALIYQATEEYGVIRTTTTLPGKPEPPPDTLDQFLLPFQATPDDTVLLLGSGMAPWWDVLGVPQGATREEIVNAFKALARVHHPDVGGDPEDFRRLREAYREALK